MVKQPLTMKHLLTLLASPFAALALSLFAAPVALAQYDGVTREEQLTLRTQFENRSYINHFFEMDTSGDWATTMEEMDVYFTNMFYTFDLDRNGVVSVEEAPTLLLQIRLLGEGFPRDGLTLTELRRRLGLTFEFLDKNNNGKLGWPEML